MDKWAPQTHKKINGIAQNQHKQQQKTYNYT